MAEVCAARINNNIPSFTFPSVRSRNYPRDLLNTDDDGIPVCISTDKCAKAIEEEMHIKTIGKEMYFYENGVYRSGGEDIIRTYLSRMFFGERDINSESISTRKAQGEIVYKLKALTRVKLEEFDKNIFIINMANGLYNWNTGEFKEHTSEYPSLIQIPVFYDPSATCDNIDKMLHIAAREKDIIKLYEFVAYMLYRGYPIQKLLVFDHVYTKEEYDETFLALLTTPQELSGLFNKVIKLLPDLIKRNAFTNQLTIAEATKLYTERSIPEEHFLNTFVQERPEEYAIKEDLYIYYKKYCSKVKLTPTSKIKFGKYTKKHFDMSNEEMKAQKTVVGITFAVWINKRFDEKEFNKWLEGQD